MNKSNATMESNANMESNATMESNITTNQQYINGTYLPNTTGIYDPNLSAVDANYWANINITSTKEYNDDGLMYPNHTVGHRLAELLNEL